MILPRRFDNIQSQTELALGCFDGLDDAAKDVAYTMNASPIPKTNKGVKSHLGWISLLGDDRISRLRIRNHSLLVLVIANEMRVALSLISAIRYNSTFSGWLRDDSPTVWFEDSAVLGWVIRSRSAVGALN
ncbi:hypothetical protein WG66_011932 [Moniliophthora roreri]|nr:hypothetical protein WG66_011932 [Moniliophthora roreri]